MDATPQDAYEHGDQIPVSKASSTTSSVRGRVTSTSVSDIKTRRPAAPRRTSTHASTVQKLRPEFSVDDNESEVEEDLNTQRIRASGPGSSSHSQMRRHSLLRRRPTGLGAPLDDTRSEHSDAVEDDEAGDDEVEGHGGEENNSYASSDADSVESFTLKV